MPTKNLVSDYGAVGDGQRQTVNITVSSSSALLTVDAAIFNPATIVGKSVAVWNGSNYKFGVVQASPTPTSTTVTLNSNFSWSVTASSSDVLWGTDNTSAFVGASGSWRAYARTQTNPADIPILQIPDGNYCVAIGASNALHAGVLNSGKITGLSGVAANCKLMQFANGELRFGTDPGIVADRGYNTTQSGGNSVRLATAAAGATATSVVDYNTTAADGSTWGSRVVVGRVCLLAAYDMQGIYESFFGYPPNSFFFEWNVISGYDAGTGAITFQNPLTQTYKSTYPRWGLEDTQFGSDLGGPFTMWVAPDGYNNTVTLENFTVDSPHNQSACHMRNWVGNNLVMNGPGLYPTQNDIVELNSCVYPQSLEIDKMTNQVTWNNSTIRRLEQQSASPNRMIINGGTIDILDTAKYTEANNVAFTNEAVIRLGVSAYGRTNQAVFNNCTGIVSIVRTVASTTDLFGSSGPGSQGNASDFYTFDSGVLKFLKANNNGNGGIPGNAGQQNPSRLLAPGTWIFFDDKYLDQVDDVYEDGTYCYIRFKNTTDWPFTPVARLKPHPCPDLTMQGCTGSAPNLPDFQLAPTRSPAYSYSKRTIVAGATAATADANQDAFLLGKFASEKLNVTTPYVGAGTLTFNDTRFLNRQYVKQSDWTTAFAFGSTVNMKVAGERVIRAATTATGAQTSDVLEDMTTPGNVNFMGNGGSTIFSANVTNGETPTITIEYTMDQGIPSPVPTAVMPLRFRLRAA